MYSVFLERAAERMHPRKLAFRLVDLGGDKILPYFPLPPSRNPSLAERGIRLLFRHHEVLKPQLRAFLRVSARHPISVPFPSVTKRAGPATLTPVTSCGARISTPNRRA